MAYTIKPTKRQLKLGMAAFFFLLVFVRYNQQRPALKEARSGHPKTAQTKPSSTPTAPLPSQSSPKALIALHKQVASSLPGTQKRYYLLDTPDDPYYASSWYLQNINAASAWATTNSSSGVTVAVIDSGFALNHQDLSGQWAANPGESGDGKETDGIDNDSNGYIDDYRGWDFVANDNTPQAGTLNSTGVGVSHGTETAGLVGATSNNGLGVSSVSRGTKLLPLQVMDDNGSGYSDDVAQAIIYSIDQGADIISMSLGTSGDDPQVRAAVDLAFQNNVLVVAAAGNCGNNSLGACSGQPAGYVTFPANYDRVVAVGASDSNNNRASFSSYGERLDIMAPGAGSIRSTTWTSGNGTSAYAATLNGTSYSAPIVASTAALIRSIRPTTSIDDLRTLLMASTNKVSPMSGAFYSQSYGHGLLNVGKAVQIASELNTSGEAQPSLQQTGGPAADHLYASGDVLGARCNTIALTWCSVWLRNDASSYDRFLPYQKADANGVASWGFTASGLNKGEWASRARQGDIVSIIPYMLLKK